MNIERAIQKALVDWIANTYPMIKVAASQNENSRHAVDLGMDVGEPDIRLLIRVGKIAYLHYLELKKTKGRLNPSQISWNADFDENYLSDNCTRSVAFGFSQAKEWVTQWYQTVLGNLPSDK